jgi:hypothetical protein
MRYNWLHITSGKSGVEYYASGKDTFAARRADLLEQLNVWNQQRDWKYWTEE